MHDGYDVIEIERKWQQRWRDWGTYEIDNDDPRPPHYVLCMYPYPSGTAHCVLPIVIARPPPEDRSFGRRAGTTRRPRRPGCPGS